MISRAIFGKMLRDSWLIIVIATLGIIVFEAFMVRMLLEGAQDLEMLRVWLERPLIKTMIALALGAELSGDFTITTLATFGFVHPVLFAILWAMLLTMTTRAIVGEIGRGTADVLLTLPVSRVAVYVSTSLVWLLACVLCSFAPLPGLWIGEQIFALPDPLVFRHIARLCVHLLTLNVCVAAVTVFVSSFASRRGVAIAIVLTMLLVSDLISLLVQFWPAVRPLRYLGFLNYYRPLPVVRADGLLWGDIGVLLAIAAVAWLAGLWHYARRDIPAA
jgi:ABC-2 type transport system permease protein